MQSWHSLTGQSKDCDTQVNVMACWPLVFCLFGGFLFENPRSPFEKLDIYPPPPPKKKHKKHPPSSLKKVNMSILHLVNGIQD